MWQVMVRSAGSIEDQIQYDSHYIRNWSLWLDIYLLARTICAVLSGRGAS
jgi:lipopolysaccharide/colanic/teichoic acid biosynthesis glycosyltransferase